MKKSTKSKTLTTIALVGTLLTTSACTSLSSPSTMMDDLGSKVGLKDDPTTITSPATKIKYDVTTGQPKPVDNYLAQCQESTASRFALVPHLEALKSATLAENRAKTLLDKTVTKAKTKGIGILAIKAENRFKSSTQACAQGLANALSVKGQWNCSAKFGSVAKPNGTAPASVLECATGVSKAESNFLARYNQVQAGEYGKNGKYTLNPSLIK